MTYDIIIFTESAGEHFYSKSLGAYRIASHLRNHGYSVKVIDFFHKWFNDPILAIKLLDKLIGSNTLFIGFSGVFFKKSNLDSIGKVETYEDFFNNSHDLSAWPGNPKAFLTILKIKYPKVKLVYGGLFRNKKVETLQHQVDYIVTGLAENTVIELSNHLRSKSPLKFNLTAGKAKLLNLDEDAASFDFPSSATFFTDDDDIFEGEVLPIETSRGCLFKCSFCSYPLLGRKKGDPDYHKTTNQMAEEFRYNYENFKINKYMFVDDTFNETTGKIEDIIRARDISGVDIEFSCYLRTDLIARYQEQIGLLKNLGLTSSYLGIESLHGPSAKAIGKGLDPEIIKETIYKMKDSWKQKANILGSFIIGLPEDNEETLEKWIPWVESLDCPIDTAKFSGLTLDDQGTSEMSRNPAKYGYELVNIQGSTRWVNKYWQAIDAHRYSVELMSRMWNSGRYRVGGWDLLGLQNIGFTREQLYRLPMKELDFKLIQEKKNAMWESYLTRLV